MTTMKTLLLLQVFVAASLVVKEATGHGAIVHPPSRNAIEGTMSPWTDGVDMDKVPFGGNGPQWCAISKGTDPHLSGSNGQACYWFSNGCSIGCPRCDGVTRGPIPLEGHHGCKGMRPLFPHNASAEDNCLRKMDTCGLGHNASVCDSRLRTYNIDAPCHGPTDWYEFSPWRAPGSAPVFDSCGVAGGKPPPRGGFGAQYYNTSKAKQGDHGSKMLPAAPSGVTWKAGSTVEVSWAIEANHGGGYQYRICPKASNLDEECFQRTPLAFSGSTALRWGGRAGHVENITGHFVTDTAPKAALIGELHSGVTVVPSGSVWAQNPIPDYGSDKGAASFEPRCHEAANCDPSKGSIRNNCRCSGEWGPYNLEIVDHVIIPADLAAGEWVVGWRWDCEESNQVWQSCSDVTIIN